MNCSKFSFQLWLNLGIIVGMLAICNSCGGSGVVETTQESVTVPNQPTVSNSVVPPPLLPTPTLVTESSKTPVTTSKLTPVASKTLTMATISSQQPVTNTLVSLATVPTTPIAITEQSPDAEIATDELYLYSGPGLEYITIQSYPRGTPLDIIGQGLDSDGLPWLFVQTPEANTGWVSAWPSLTDTQNVNIFLPLADIALWPTPIPNAPTEMPTPFVAIEVLPAMPNPLFAPTPVQIATDTPSPILATIPPGSVGELPIMISPIPPWEITGTPSFTQGTPSFSGTIIPYPMFGFNKVIAVSCNELCTGENEVENFSSSEDVCLQWYEEGNWTGTNIKLSVLLADQELGFVEFDGIGSNVCRIAQVRLNTPGVYKALFDWGLPYGTDVEWNVD